MSKFWRGCPGVIIEVKYPTIESTIDEINYQYLPFLEKHVGIRFQDWDWKFTSGGVAIKIFDSNSKYASILKLMWG